MIRNGFRIAYSTRKPSESLLEASWSALGGSWSRKKVLLNRSWALLERSRSRKHSQDPPVNSASLRPPGYSPSNSPSFSCVEEAIEAWYHLQSRFASVLSGIRIAAPPGLLPLELPLLLLRRSRPLRPHITFKHAKLKLPSVLSGIRRPTSL